MSDAVWQAWIDRLAVAPAGHDRGSLFPRSLFHCCLDDQPDHLVPAHLLRPERWEGLSDRPLFLNPSCHFVPQGGLPPEAPTADFANEGEMVWVTDPGSNALQPFWLGCGLSNVLSGTRPGDPAPSTLSPQARHSLMMANLLVPDDYASERRRHWAEIVAVTRAQFQSQGYAPIRGLIHPFHIAALRRYYRHRIRTGKLTFGDGQSLLRYNSYNDPVARFFHYQLTGAVTAFAGEPLKASYVYLVSYQSGAVLEKHTDREQCDFSVTLCLDYAPEPRCATPWPLVLHKKSGTAKVFQAIGDALLYRGCQLPHSRGPLPQGHTSSSIFFHFVREDFTGSLD